MLFFLMAFLILPIIKRRKFPPFKALFKNSKSVLLFSLLLSIVLIILFPFPDTSQRPIFILVVVSYYLLVLLISKKLVYGKKN